MARRPPPRRRWAGGPLEPYALVYGGPGPRTCRRRPARPHDATGDARLRGSAPRPPTRRWRGRSPHRPWGMTPAPLHRRALPRRGDHGTRLGMALKDCRDSEEAAAALERYLELADAGKGDATTAQGATQRKAGGRGSGGVGPLGHPEANRVFGWEQRAVRSVVRHFVPR